MGDQQHPAGRMSFLEPLDQLQDPYLHLDHRLPPGTRVPLRKLFQADQRGSNSSSSTVRLVQSP